MNWGIPKFKIWHDVKHIAVLSNLNVSMSRITVIENKSYLNWSIFELRIDFLFSFFTAHILLVNMNILFNMNVLLCWPFTRHIWKAIFLPLSRNCHGTYLPNILKQTTQNIVQEEMKNASPIFISWLIFAFSQNSYFHIIFTILFLAQIRRIICWGKRIKETQMNQFLYLSTQVCQAWMEYVSEI